jgi:hypothetical protein
VDCLELQKYHGIGQTLVSKTAFSFIPKQPRVFNTRIFLQNHGMVSKIQKKILCIQTEPSNFLNSRKLNGINIPDQIISIINSGNFLRPPFTLRSFSICLSNNSKELEPD